MGKPLLTPEGVAEQVVALYELSPAELEAVADVINADIRSWLLDTFDVTAAQESYLDQLNPVYLAALGEQTARALRHRWPIVYIAHGSEIAPRSAKWIKSREEDEAGDGNGARNSIHTGSLTIETGY